MAHPLTRFATSIAVVTLAGCALPASPVNLGGALQVNALAVTAIDNPSPPNVAYKVLLNWQTALGAKTYEIRRQFGTAASTLLASQGDTKYTDMTVSATQGFAYTVRALDGNGKELTVSNPVTVTVPTQQVAKPSGLMPADNTKLAATDSLAFTWAAVPTANWYFVSVTNGQSHSQVYGALTQATTVKFGAASTLQFSNFSDLFPLGQQSSPTSGVVYYWSVKAIRGDVADDPNKAKGIDVNSSDQLSFTMQ